MLLTNRIASNLDPWRVMRALEEQWNQHLGDWFDTASPLQPQASVRVWTGDGQAVVEFDVPGYAPNQIDVAVHQNQLKVEVKPLDEPAGEGEQYHLRERAPVTRRELQLPFAVDPQRTEAEYRHGVLRVTVHQPESHRPAKISVKG